MKMFTRTVGAFAVIVLIAHAALKTNLAESVGIALLAALILGAAMGGVNQSNANAYLAEKYRQGRRQRRM